MLVVIFQRENAFIRPVGIGQKLAQRIGIFKGGSVQRIKAIALIDIRYGGNHALLQHKLRARHIAEPARHARFGFECLLLFSHWCSPTPECSSLTCHVDFRKRNRSKSKWRQAAHMLIKAQIAIDRRRRPLVAVMAFAQAAIYPDRRVARFHVEIDAA